MSRHCCLHCDYCVTAHTDCPRQGAVSDCIAIDWPIHGSTMFAAVMQTEDGVDEVYERIQATVVSSVNLFI